MRTFVIGDIHGAHKALVQCLNRSGFDYHHDHLISLGDVCDGWPETRESVNELLKVKKLTYILGNHDYWTLQWMSYGQVDDIWLSQGGGATLKSYDSQPDPDHLTFFERSLPYFLFDRKGATHDDHSSLFVHAGINPLTPIEEQSLNIFLWDRNLSRMALDFYNKGINNPLTKYQEVYIGHTPVGDKPVHSCGVWMMDTGAGWSGVLSMMDVDSEEITQSDPVPLLYPGIEGRSRS